ncbi:MAG: ATP-binding protein, partial [Alphaproteobacteria bacterium]
TGLGLAIVKHIVSRHRGVLQVESELNKGSVFRVILPGETPL